MKRYYVADIIGTGAEDDPFRPAVADYRATWSSVVADKGWALVLVDAPDHAQLLADKRLDALPLDRFGAEEVERGRAIARKRGVVMKDAADLKSLLRGLGAELALSFNEATLRVR